MVSGSVKTQFETDKRGITSGMFNPGTTGWSTKVSEASVSTGDPVSKSQTCGTERAVRTDQTAKTVASWAPLKKENTTKQFLAPGEKRSSRSFGGLYSTMVAFFLLTQRPLIWFLVLPKIFYFEVTEIYWWRLLEESGQRLENVDQTHQASWYYK